MYVCNIRPNSLYDSCWGCGLMLRVLLLLALLERSTHTQARNELPERCKYLSENQDPWYQRCRGQFPLVAYTKFRDTFMKQSDKMALFMPDSLDHVMVALKESELHQCFSIQFIAVNEYVCYNSDGGKRTVRFAHASMYCFPFHIQLADDLMHECLKERDDVTNSPIEEKVLQTKRGIIHYIFDNESGVRPTRQPEASLCMRVLTLLLLLVLL